MSRDPFELALEKMEDPFELALEKMKELEKSEADIAEREYSCNE